MKKGFTLIELLAVIVILAIIALIATPIVLNIINDAKESSLLRSADFYIDALENEIMLENMKQGGSFNQNVCNVINENLSCDGKEIALEVDGEVPKGGSITFEEGKVTNVNLTYTSGNITMNNKGELVLEDIPEPKSFAEDSWDTITLNVRVGNLSKYKVGDTKEITLTSENTDIAGTYTVRIANTSTLEECKTKGFSQTACGFVIEFEDIITTHNMNPKGEYKGIQYDSGWNVDGYPASSMYTYLQNDIYNALPEELKSVIIPTFVVSGHGLTTGEENFITTDNIYLLSGKEVYGSDSYDTSATLTRQLDYYSNLGVTTSSYSGAIKKLNGTANYWWLRSAASDLTHAFRCVSSTGKLYGNSANIIRGVAVAFRIG